MVGAVNLSSQVIYSRRSVPSRWAVSERPQSRELVEERLVPVVQTSVSSQLTASPGEVPASSVSRRLNNAVNNFTLVCECVKVTR